MKVRHVLRAALLAFGIASAGLTSAVSAASYDSGLLLTSIPNPGTLITGIDVTDSVTVGNVSVTLSIDHTWVGDLIIKLEAPDGTVEDLICRPGSPNCGDTFGNSDNLSALAGTYTFADSGATVLNDAAVLNGYLLGGVFTASTENDVPVSLATAFGGVNSSGQWLLTIQDVVGDDSGVLGSWTLDITPVPIPAAIWLFGSGVLGLVGIARRKKA